MIRISLLAFLSFLFFNHHVLGQATRQYRQHEIIDAGNGLKIEILQCRGAGEEAECDVIYYTDKRQQGKRVWEKTQKIRELEKAAKTKTVIKNKDVPVTKPVPTEIKEIENKHYPDPVINSTQTKADSPVNITSKVKPFDAYTLQQCFKMAVDRNIGLKRATNNIENNIIDNKSAKYNLLPSVSYDFSHYFSSGKNIDPVTNTFINESFSGGSTALGLQVDLFSGFSRLNTIKQTSYLIEAAEALKRKTELDLLTNVALTYARLLTSKEQIQIQRNNLLSTAKQLQIIEEKINVGRLTKYEAYAFSARLNTEQANLISIQNDSSAALQDLKNLLNINYKQQFDIAPVDTILLSQIYATTYFPAALIDSVLKNHPAILQAQKEEQAAELSLKIIKGNVYPSLFAAGNIASNYNINQTNAIGQKISFDQQLNNNIGKNVSIGLHVPIFSQMRNSGLIKKQKIYISNAQLNRQEIENTIITNTFQLLNDFNASRQKYNATLLAYNQNVLSFSMYEEKYKLGQLSSMELLAARDILNTATLKYLQAKLELFFRYQLLLLLQK